MSCWSRPTAACAAVGRATRCGCMPCTARCRWCRWSPADVVGNSILIYLDDGWMLYIWLPADERWMDNSWLEEGGVSCSGSCRQSSRPWSTEGAFPRTTNSQESKGQSAKQHCLPPDAWCDIYRLSAYHCEGAERGRNQCLAGDNPSSKLCFTGLALIWAQTPRERKSSTCPWWPLAGRDIELFGNKCAVCEATSARTSTFVPSTTCFIVNLFRVSASRVRQSIQILEFQWFLT